MALCHAKFTVNTDFIFLVLMVAVVGLIALAWKGPELFTKYQKDPMRALARMARHARRHNTGVRYFNNKPYVITHQSRGLVYMVEGGFVTREKLIKVLGESCKYDISKAEEQEEKAIPNPTRLTMLAPPEEPKTNKASKLAAQKIESRKQKMLK